MKRFATSTTSICFSRPVISAGLCAAMTLSTVITPAVASASTGAQDQVAPLALQTRAMETADAQEPAAPAPEAAPAPAPEPAAAPAPAPAAAPAPAPMQPAPSSPPPKKGIGLIIGGSATAAPGLLLLGLGAAGLAGLNAADNAADNPDDDALVGASKGVIIGGCLVPGILLTLGGGAMVAVGAIRLTKYQEWKRNNGFTLKNGAVLAPMVSATQHRTGTYGMNLRF